MPTEDIEVGGEYDGGRILADTALVIEALAAFAGHPGELKTPRQRRAWVLISDLADDLGMTPSEVFHADMDVFSQYHS